MSFPLQNLTYESRQRLHEIATPLELYRLQRAVCSSFAIGQTRQKITTLANLHSLLIMRGMLIFALGTTNGEFAKNITHSLKDDCLLRITKPVSFWLIRKSDLRNDVFNHLAFETSFVSIEGCHLDCAFVDLLAEKFIKPITNFSIDQVSYAGQFTFTYLFKVFPKISYFKLNLSTMRTKWVQTLADIKNTNAKKLDLIGSPRQLLNFKLEELLEFMKKQSKNFKIHLICQQSLKIRETMEQLEKLMQGSRFFEKYNRRNGRSIRIDVDGRPVLAYQMKLR